ncbi:MAG: VanW family protein [Clostridiales bacterium]|nr:VanW family protein [Clostridiales bacterium]
MQRHRFASVFFLFLGCSLFSFSRPAMAAPTITDETKIEEGVQVQSLDLGGKTKAEARTMIEEYFSRIASSSITVTYSDKQAEITASQLGLTWDADTAADQAAFYGKVGSLITRYKERTDLRYDSASVEVDYQYDKEAIEQFVTEQIASQDTEAVDASLTRENGEFIVSQEVNGLKTNVSKTVENICSTLEKSLSENMTVEAVAEVSLPKRTAEQLSQVQDRLSTFSTSYSTSSSARKTNIRVASQRLNGQILMPGESLSVSDTILSRTAANGYELAPQYVNGTSEDAYGGGVCQVSTTLYNAVIRAELQVDERHPHSMVVGYVPYASDAAIAEGSKDLVFSNNTDSPIYIASSADGYTLTFSIYGKETRSSDRTVDFISYTISKTTPDPIIKEDPTLEEGTEQVSGSIHPAVKATLTKVVYVNGVETERTLLHTDVYQGTTRTIIRGTKKKEPESTEPASTESPETPSETAAEKPSKDNTEEPIDPPEPDEEPDPDNVSE